MSRATPPTFTRLYVVFGRVVAKNRMQTQDLGPGTEVGLFGGAGWLPQGVGQGLAREAL